MSKKAYRANLLAIYIGSSGHGEKVPEQFIGPVNEVHIHTAPISSLRTMLLRIE
jgi:hypothetical protein